MLHYGTSNSGGRTYRSRKLSFGTWLAGLGWLMLATALLKPEALYWLQRSIWR